jgi:hypothetical protein
MWFGLMMNLPHGARLPRSPGSSDWKMPATKRVKLFG